MKLREVEDEAVGDYLAAKCTVGRPRWTSGLWSAVMPTVCYGTYTYIYIYTKTKTHANKKHKVRTHTPKSAFIMQHLAFSALNLIILQTVHTNIQYI